ncbi:MAG: ATP-grasp domain-containing protein [Lachnospiraceae bacterium]|nr:ATP-grasp domain-containing protein [Lachnospiraceae bacterium]
MKNKIVIIGSNEHQNPLIIKAKEMGYETHVFAWQMGDVGEKTADFYYPISITNKQAILEKCRFIEPQGIISMASDLAAITAAYLAKEMNCIGNTPDIVEVCTNKLLFRKRLQECKVNQPAFVEVGDIFPEEKVEAIHFPVVVKPSDRSGNRGVAKACNRKEMIRALMTAKEYSFERKAIIEEYISGDYYSCECYTENGNHVLVALTKRESIEYQNNFLDYTRTQSKTMLADEEIKEKIFSVLDAVNMQNGASSVEFVKNEQGIWIIEVMPSMYGDYVSTDLVPVVHDFDYVRKSIEIACGIHSGSYNFTKVNAGSASVKFVLSQDDYKEYHNSYLAGKILHSSKFDEAQFIPGVVTGIPYGYFIKKVEK